MLSVLNITSVFSYNLMSHRLPHLCFCLTQRGSRLLCRYCKPHSPFLKGCGSVLPGNGPGSSERCSSGVSQCHNISPSGNTVCISVSHLALQVKKCLPRCFKFVLIKRGLVYVCPCLSWKQSFVFPLAARCCLKPSPLLLFLCCEL